ncbi:hypothetical protein PBPRB0822 [Photobacterium profundum SS9]|uniref:Uncharacterized protein n=1 Tax=Photobacterium profundum (strain SS9) TaxID=298386 RepID=Q6LJ36_PHOPR|nr:hypothetical protein PBPRB0822 [Photobacterium profundum SS9]
MNHSLLIINICYLRRYYSQLLIGNAFFTFYLNFNLLTSSRVRRYRLIPLTEPYVRTSYTAPVIFYSLSYREQNSGSHFVYRI